MKMVVGFTYSLIMSKDNHLAKVVKEIFRLYPEGYGQDKIARHLQDKGIKNCTAYWQERGIGRGGKKV